MKKLLVLIMCLVLLISFSFPVKAAENGEVVYSDEYRLDDGLTVRREVVVYSQNRSSTKTAQNRNSIYDGDTLVAVIVLQATFRYDGSSVSVVSKSVTQSDTYDGWTYVQNSLTSSGGTVTLNAKLTKWIILNTSFTMTLSCDKDGNISY